MYDASVEQHSQSDENCLVLDDQQARLVTAASQPVEVRDRLGRHIGFVTPGFTREDIEIAKQRRDSGQRSYTTQEVLEYLRSLEAR